MAKPNTARTPRTTMPSTGRRITSPPTTPNTRGTPTTIGLMPRETQFFTAVSLAVELGAPLSLLDRRLGLAFSAAAWGMHIGIREIMGISFPYNTSGVSYLGHLPAGPQLRR